MNIISITKEIFKYEKSYYYMFSSLSPVLKNYGQQLKAPAAMVRLRLYETLLLLPPQTFEGKFFRTINMNLKLVCTLCFTFIIHYHIGSYTHLLRMLVSEFTLTDNPGNTTTSLLRVVCHANDSVILGTWLQETDHRTIEDQVSVFQLSLNRRIMFVPASSTISLCLMLCQA